MERCAALVVAAAIVLSWIVAVSPVLFSSALIAAVAIAWCRALDHPA
jgi:hypothetical protein